MTKVALPKWTEDRTATLISIIGDVSPVTPQMVADAAASLGEGTTARSVASKLRKMEYEVESSAKSTAKSYTDEEEASINDFLDKNPSQFTYAEIAAQVLGGSRSAKQIQGKILSMDRTADVKATEKVERAKSFTDAEEEILLGLLLQTPALFIEEIAGAVKRPINEVRGKILSMTKKYEGVSIPKQKEYKTKDADAFSELGDVSEMTDEDIAAKIDKSVRGVRTLLTHRGINCANYKGEDRKSKLDEAKAAVLAEAA